MALGHKLAEMLPMMASKLRPIHNPQAAWAEGNLLSGYATLAGIAHLSIQAQSMFRVYDWEVAIAGLLWLVAK